ncbi:MAG: type III restriction endonuclease subunit R, partial [Armatimonadetes bacterium]|nr:type III restriction endonuclease subunit R [Armatimonadota bacterium]
MQLKDYQQRVLDVLDSYVDELNAQRERMRKLLAANAGETDPDLRRDVPEFPRKAWEALNARGALPPPRRTLPYSSRRTGDGHDVPNATLKVPTGGGKTLLAAACVSRILARYLQANTGVVLWIVPNEAIFAQTRKQLSDRDHPYRQMLDRAAAGKVKVLTKESPLSRTDVEGSLCVLLLMLQSANRQTKETLRLFRDRGNVHGFVPAEADWDAHVSLLTSVNNLDRYADELTLQPLVKDRG